MFSAARLSLLYSRQKLLSAFSGLIHGPKDARRLTWPLLSPLECTTRRKKDAFKVT